MCKHTCRLPQALSSVLCLVIASLARADVDVGQVAIYDASILGDTAMIVNEETVAITTEAPPALLLPYLESDILQFAESPMIVDDCDVVEKWPEVSLYFSNVLNGLALYESSFNFRADQAQGAIDLAVSLLDSMDAPPESQCTDVVYCNVESAKVATLPGVPCRECDLNIGNVEGQLFEIEHLIPTMAAVRDKGLNLVNEIVAKIANPGSFEAHDYACDRVCAGKLQNLIDGFHFQFGLAKSALLTNIDECTLEVAMAECENCPQSESLIAQIGPTITEQLASGAFQRVPPEPILGGVADSLERAIRGGRENREMAGPVTRVIRKLRSLAEKGNVLHAVIPALEDTTLTYIAIGNAPARDDDGEGWEEGRPLSAVVFTAAQRDSGLPAPNLNDRRKTVAARQAFARRVPRDMLTTFEDLERNETLNRIMPDWRDFFPGESR